jgi:hypothetical protein
VPGVAKASPGHFLPMRTCEPEKLMTPEFYGHSPNEIMENVALNKKIDSDNNIWSQNVLANEYAFRNDKSIKDMYGQWEGMKTLVVGAGPSANTHVRGIKKKQDAGWKIIAVDRVHKMLRENDIVPDLTIACDAQKTVGGFLSEVDEKDTVVMNISQDPTIVRTLKSKAGKSYFYALANPYSRTFAEWFSKYDKNLFCIRAGYVVGFAATDLAYWMGSRIVALIGNEFSWKSKSSIEEIYKKEMIFKIKDNEDGKIRYSISAFMCAADIFHIFKRHDDCDFINCSDGIIKSFRRKDINSLS